MTEKVKSIIWSHCP